MVVSDKAPEVQRLLREFPPRREEAPEGDLLHGLRVRMGLRCTGTAQGAARSATAVAEIQLSDSSRFYPSDAALAAWSAQVGAGSATVVYE
ncbi:hypothetical protein D3C71_1861980 [compost metagenome]